MVIYCKRCGYANPDNVNYCLRCGFPLKMVSLRHEILPDVILS
ncbi:zinc-ribbon domain-containing protein [Stygiolobus sp. CP859M]